MNTMALTIWSWIFAFQLLFLVQPGRAQLNGNFNRVLARRVMEGVFIRGLSDAEKTRHTFIGVAVACSVVLVAGVVGIFLWIRKSRQDEATSDPEALQVPPVEKPNWWMVDGNDSKGDWWRLSLQPASTVAFPAQSKPQQPGRTDRLKTALQLHKAKDAPVLPPVKKVTSPADTITLPFQSIPVQAPLRPNYPKAMEKVYYSTPSPPRSEEDKPRVPHPIVINPDLMRTRGPSEHRRLAVPRSPAHRRRSKAMRSQRNPFLPLNTPTISQPMAVSAAQLSHPKLSHPLGKPRSALRVPLGPGPMRPPVPPKLRPAPLDLEDIGSQKAVRFDNRF